MTRFDFYISTLAEFTGQDEDIIRKQMTHYRNVAEDNSFLDDPIPEEEAEKMRQLIQSDPLSFARLLSGGAVTAHNKTRSN